ncbi:MAG: hypothetical protein ACI4EO_10150 [Blautia sp.]
MMKRKKLRCLFLAAVLVCSMTGCGNTETQKTDSTAQEEQAASTAEKEIETGEKENTEPETPEKEDSQAEPEETPQEEETGEESTEQAEVPAETVKEGGIIVLYVPNENADGWTISETEISQVSPDAIIGQLVGAGVIVDSVTVQSFEEMDEGDSLILKLDLSDNFAEGLRSMGSAGETLLMGAVVNSFLDTYGADGIQITAGGNPIETGHTIYEGTLSHMSE